MGMYEPIPSLDGKYEISSCGNIRNSVTKKQLKIYPNGLQDKRVARTVNVWKIVNGVPKFVKGVSLEQLLWEVHGVIPKRLSKPAVPVLIEKGNERYTFPSLKKAVKFLAQAEYYSEKHIMRKFSLRLKDVFGWRIKYFEEKRIMRSPSEIINHKELMVK